MCYGMVEVHCHSSHFRKQRNSNSKGKRLRLQIVKMGGRGEVKEFDSRWYQLFLTDKDEKSVNVEVLGIDSISTDIAEV